MALKEKFLFQTTNTFANASENNLQDNIVLYKRLFIKSLDSIDATRLQYTDDNDRDKLDVITASFKIMFENRNAIDTLHTSPQC